MDEISPLVDTEVIEKRDYQLNIFQSIKDKDSLVVLPTGLGKTAVAFYLICQRVEESEKVLMMAPTRPLCQQHLDFIRDSTGLDEEDTELITGELYTQEEREEIWKKDYDVFIATPQAVNNDLHLVPISSFGLMVFDEVHRAVGDYAYVEIAKACKEKVQFLGLTASPGSSFEDLVEVCYNLGIQHIEVRTQKDEDVEPYVGERRLDWVEIEKSEELQKMESWLDSMLQDFLEDLSDYTRQAKNMKAENVGKKALIDTQENLQKRIKSGKGNKGYLFHALSLTSASIKVTHLKELLLTQGIDAAHRYLLRLQEDDDRSSKYVKKKEEFDLLSEKLLDLKAMPIEMNQKLTETKKILREELKDVDINLHAFFINIFGLLDNMAWVIVHENIGSATDIDKKKVGLYQTETQKVMKYEFKQYLNADRTKKWHNEYLKNYRNALAHRIPLYVPPKRIST
ncbi:MAG: DEAD/DEAH box helicase, partial [Candidatus Natronoplasma sp.]